MIDRELKLTVMIMSALVFVLLLVFVVTGVIWFHVENHKLNRILRQTCTYGASSITATLKNGKFYANKPHTTGCTK